MVGKMSEISTKERILDASEQLFAEKGIKETTLRDITGALGINCAAVNYHFSSKNRLIKEVISRRLTPLNEKRLALLDACDTGGDDKDVVLGEVLNAWMAPTVELCMHHPHFMRLAGRILSEPNLELHYALTSPFDRVFMRFESALSGILPELPEEELMWRMHFIVGAMIHTWTSHTDLGRLTGGVCILSDEDTMVKRLVSFCAEGLRAPLPEFGEEQGNKL
jgi:AcrR family transcriptional regulator